MHQNDRYEPCVYIAAKTRSPTVVAEDEDGGPIKVSGEEWAVKQNCCQADAERLQHSWANQLASMKETGKHTVCYVLQ